MPESKRRRLDNGQSGVGQTAGGPEQQEASSSSTVNRCDLLWQGVLPKKTFHAFRFQVVAMIKNECCFRNLL